jgi:mannitol-1-/sugar-/sorbitol-6-/2-deoxyglucose-6-phosphatase
MKIGEKTHIFDMDGLLIDSEPFWRKAEVRVFTHYGIPFTEDMCRQTVGMRIDEVVHYWAKEYPIIADKIHLISNEIQDELIALVKSEGKALPGVYAALETLKKHQRKCALASSSSMRIINEVVDALTIRSYFQVIHSAEFEKQGKPHPDVFLSTANMLQSTPQDCIVYEDSKNGMLAGIRAGMKVVLIPEFPYAQYDWFQQANLKLNSLEEFNLEEIERL